MPSRRRFLGAIAFLASAAGAQPLFAGRRRFCRRTDGVKQPVIDRNGAFADGYRYSDANVEIQIPKLAGWQKLRLGMSRQEVKQLLGPPLEGEGSATPAAFRAESIRINMSYGFSRSDAEAIADMEATEDKKYGVVHREGWTYGELRFRSLPLFDDQFAVNFEGDELVCMSDPFNEFKSPGDAPGVQWRLDGRPTTPILLSPYDNAPFRHTPFFVDYRWLPSCGVYPMEYVLEVSFAQDIYDEKASRKVREWIVCDEPTSFIPHHADRAPGSNPARWRLKARNRLGESAWTEYRHYDFNSAIRS
jgi:hypothetical protein